MPDFRVTWRDLKDAPTTNRSSLVQAENAGHAAELWKEAMPGSFAGRSGLETRYALVSIVPVDSPEAQIEALRAENTRLRDELKTAKYEASVYRGMVDLWSAKMREMFPDESIPYPDQIAKLRADAGLQTLKEK